jgi:hypothetical protein
MTVRLAGSAQPVEANGSRAVKTHQNLRGPGQDRDRDRLHQRSNSTLKYLEEKMLIHSESFRDAEVCRVDLQVAAGAIALTWSLRG